MPNPAPDTSLRDAVCAACGALTGRDADELRVTRSEEIEYGLPHGAIICAACWHAMLWPPKMPEDSDV